MKKLHINWQDGMKVSKTHFEDMENAMRRELLDMSSARLTEYNYGLLASTSGEAPFDIYMKLDQSNELVLTLRSCRAITPGGAFIEIQPEQQLLQEYRIPRETIQTRMQNVNADIYVTVNINTARRQPFGEPAQDESPIRQPYTMPLTFLNVQSLKEVSHGNIGGISQLIVGRIKQDQKELKLDPDYFPPSSSVKAHRELLEKVRIWQRQLKDILFRSLEATLVKTTSLKQNNDPAFVAHEITLELLQGIGDVIPLFFQRLDQPIIFTFSDLQRLCYRVLVKKMEVSDKIQEFENYINKALNISGFFDVLNRFSGVEYKHDRIDEAVNAGQEFLDALVNLYKELPTKDFQWREIKRDTITFNENASQSTKG